MLVFFGGNSLSNSLFASSSSFKFHDHGELFINCVSSSLQLFGQKLDDTCWLSRETTRAVTIGTISCLSARESLRHEKSRTIFEVRSLIEFHPKGVQSCDMIHAISAFT